MCSEAIHSVECVSKRYPPLSDVCLSGPHRDKLVGAVTEINSSKCSAPRSLALHSICCVVATVTSRRSPSQVNGSVKYSCFSSPSPSASLSGSPSGTQHRGHQSDRDSFPGKMCEKIFQLTATAPAPPRPPPARWFSGSFPFPPLARPGRGRSVARLTKIRQGGREEAPRLSCPWRGLGIYRTIELMSRLVLPLTLFLMLIFKTMECLAAGKSA